MNMKNMGDNELLSLYVSGSEEAFSHLVKRHKSKVYSTIYLIVRDQDESEDLLQDTFIKAIHKLRSGQYNEEGKFLPWILRIAHNMAIDKFRRKKRYPTTTLEDENPEVNSVRFSEDSFEQVKIKEETHALLKRLIEQLPDTQREVLVMRHYGELSFQEIADATGVSINTALGRMRYALINLRKRMDQLNIAYDQNLYS
jgi:RNA polymerase sigma factor (sigma-70 family)